MWPFKKKSKTLADIIREGLLKSDRPYDEIALHVKLQNYFHEFERLESEILSLYRVLLTGKDESASSK